MAKPTAKIEPTPDAASIESRVAAVADRRARAGEAISNEAIRTELGGGSMREIAPALRAWRERQRQSEPSTPVPDEILQAAQPFLRGTWAAAEKRANEAVSALRERLGSKIQELESETADYSLEVKRLEDQVGELTTSNALLNRNLRAAAASAAAAAARADAAAAELGAVRVSERAVIGEVAVLRSRLESATAALAKAGIELPQATRPKTARKKQR